MKILIENISAIILAGGESSRMGCNKGLLKVGNKTIIEIISELLTKVFSKVIISTNDFDQYKFLNMPMVKDFYKNHGPLSGIHSGLVNSTTEKNYFLSYDMPLMTEETIRYIISDKTEKKIVVPFFNGRTQYLCGIYSKSIISDIEKLFSNYPNETSKNGKSYISVKKLIERIGAEQIQDNTFHFFNEDVFFNMNSPDDYEFIKSKILE